ncbi:MAG: tetratricopeptide repeat protein [Blastocatellales bacterium]
MRLQVPGGIVVVLILLGIHLSKSTCSMFASSSTVVNSQSATKWVSSEELLMMARKRVEPVYSPAATAIRIHTLVPQIEVKINREGDVIFARAVSGASLLRDAAIEAAKSWKFVPIQNKKLSAIIGIINFGFPAEIPVKSDSRGVRYYQDEVKNSPQSWLAHCRLATAYLADNQLTQAISEYQQALSLSPESAVVHYGLGDCYRQIQQYEKALGCFQTAVRLEPGFVEAYEAVGLTQKILGGVENSILYSSELYEGQIVMGEERKGQPKFDWERLSQAILAYQHAMNARQDLDIKEANLKEIALVYYIAGKLGEAIKQYEEIVKLDYELFSHGHDFTRSGPGRSLNTLASLYKKIGHYQEAILAYQQIIDFESFSEDSFMASMSMAALYKMLGKQAEVMAICERWLDYVNKNVEKNSQGEADEMRGRIYMEMDRYQEAILYFKKAAAKKPSNSIRPNEYLYDLYLKVGNQKEAAKQKEIIRKFYDEWERPMREGNIIRVKP